MDHSFLDFLIAAHPLWLIATPSPTSHWRVVPTGRAASQLVVDHVPAGVVVGLVGAEPGVGAHGAGNGGRD